MFVCSLCWITAKAEVFVSVASAIYMRICWCRHLKLVATHAALLNHIAGSDRLDLTYQFPVIPIQVLPSSIMQVLVRIMPGSELSGSDRLGPILTISGTVKPAGPCAPPYFR